MGLRHIFEKRGLEFVNRIPEMLRTGRVEKDENGLPRAYVVDAHDPAHVAVIRMDWDGQQKTWLVTAYEDIDGKFAGGSKLSDTATTEVSEVPSVDGFVFSQEPGNSNIADQKPKGKAAQEAKEPAAQKERNTENAGEELKYNLRNRRSSGLKWDEIKDHDAALRVKEVTKNKVYPKPDYEALSGDDQLGSKVLAHFIKDQIVQLGTATTCQNCAVEVQSRQRRLSLHTPR